MTMAVLERDPVAVLAKLEASGFRLAVVPSGRLRVWPANRITPELEQAIRHHRDQLKALIATRGKQTDDPKIGWRMAAMRQQLPPTPAPNPLLMARPGIDPGPGECQSCGNPLEERPAIGVGRCEPCRQAAWRVLEDRAEVVG